MAGLNPLTTQGNLNRVATHVVVPDFPQLNVTAGYMAKGQAVVTFEGPFVQQIGTATGNVNSPEPYVMATLVINLLRSQALSNLWIAQAQSTGTIGTVEVYPDSTTMQPLLISNCSIQDYEPGAFDGADPTVKVTVKGTFYVNSLMWASLTGSLPASL
jgi:hypothetical protein